MGLWRASIPRPPWLPPRLPGPNGPLDAPLGRQGLLLVGHHPDVTVWTAFFNGSRRLRLSAIWYGVHRRRRSEEP